MICPHCDKQFDDDWAHEPDKRVECCICGAQEGRGWVSTNYAGKQICDGCFRIIQDVERE